MKLYTFTAVQKLPITIHEAWNFFSDPRNLNKITPGHLKFKMTSGEFDKMYQGMIINYKVRPLLNIPVNWITEITHVNAPFYFADEQRFGPYKFWHHQHIFEETEDGVLMKDIVNYAMPFGLIGRILNKLLVAKRVKEIFSYRQNYLEKNLAHV